jgi:hypothetical protein
VTPTECATLSPNALVIASPGISSFFSHTLKGPIGFLLWSLNESTRPPLKIILFASSGWHGFWSRLTAWLLRESLSILQTIARESPTLKQNNFYPKIRMLTQVLPLNLVSIAPFTSSWLHLKQALLIAVHTMSVFNGIFCYYFCSS